MGEASVFAKKDMKKEHSVTKEGATALYAVAPSL